MSRSKKTAPKMIAALLLALTVLAGCNAEVPAAEPRLSPKPAIDSRLAPTTIPTTGPATERAAESPTCQRELEPHVLENADQLKWDQPRYTLSQEELASALGVMGIESICLPVEWGPPFILADWDSAEGSVQSGRMLSIGFESLYYGAGWSDAAIVYATYDFEAGTEYDVFATQDDLKALRAGTMPDVLTVGGAEGFSRPFASVPMGMQWVWKTVVFPFEDGYLVIALRLGEFDPATIDDTLVEVREGNYPIELQPDVERMEALVSSIQFVSTGQLGLSINLVSNFTNPRDADASSLDGLDLQRPPLVVGNDIVHYDLAAHEIELTEEAFGQIVSLFALPVDTDGIPFVVAVSGEPIYSGAFYTPASSISYDGVVILEPLSGNPNTISIQLGYPGLEAFDGEDPRSDPRIITAAQSFQR